MDKLSVQKKLKYESVSPQTLEHSCSEVELSSLVQLKDQDDLDRWVWMGMDGCRGWRA